MENVGARVLNMRLLRIGAMVLLLVIAGLSAANGSLATGLRIAHLVIALLAGAVLAWTLLAGPKRKP